MGNETTNIEASTALAGRSEFALLYGEWQPIETAPKDGTWVLAINAKTNPGRQHVVKYSEKQTEKYPWTRDDAPMGWVAGITHWMPLPAPPAI